MDQVSKRYSDPCFFIDGMIQTGRLPEFVDSLIDTTNKEKEEQANWEFFLHKVFEGSYSDFVEELKINKENQSLTTDDIRAIVNSSLNIMNTFNPTK